MKKTLLYTAMACMGLAFGSCSDYLDTNSSKNPPATEIFKDAESARTMINGIYRNFYAAGWSDGWPHENCGLMGIILTADLTGEDHVMYGSGQGWFYYDYLLSTQGDYSHTSGHPYAFWNLLYTNICNANELLAHKETLPGDKNHVKALMAEAYAVRALCYHYLIQIYQQTYVGNEDKPGVPVYTLPTDKTTPGAPRGTMRDTYKRINEDIDSALAQYEYIKAATGEYTVHGDPSNIDYYVANGLKARICMTQNRYADAEQAAKEALKAPYARIAKVAEFNGMNDATFKNVLWGMKVQTDQEGGFPNFFSHMDASNASSYGARAQKCIGANLYNKISNTDDRKAWFNGILDEETGGDNVNYCQHKFQMKDKANMCGDYIFMRMEEMLLIKAEAECMQDKYTDARNTLKELMQERDPKGYEKALEAVIDSKQYNDNTNAPVVTLMDAILTQRRIELWGEFGRVFDLKRLNLGYSRDYQGSNHTDGGTVTEPGDLRFVLPLPQTEIDGNSEITEDDNNPFY